MPDTEGKEGKEGGEWGEFAIDDALAIMRDYGAVLEYSFMNGKGSDFFITLKTSRKVVLQFPLEVKVRIGQRSSAEIKAGVKRSAVTKIGRHLSHYPTHRHIIVFDDVTDAEIREWLADPDMQKLLAKPYPYNPDVMFVQTRIPKVPYEGRALSKKYLAVVNLAIIELTAMCERAVREFEDLLR